jgi:glycosyltransferase involved in cell wall biosynthesis
MRPLVSIVVETVTAREDGSGAALAEALRPTLEAVGRQTWPAEAREVLIVTGPEATAAEVEALRRAWPDACLVASPLASYFAAKNAGAAAARGDYVALLDADCVPAPDWVEKLLARFEPGVGSVAGRTRYPASGGLARLLSIPDFAYAFAAPDGGATGFHINNIAFRREVLITHPFEARIRRNGGCYLLFHRLRAHGIGIVYEPEARTEHALDASGIKFLRKHFDRGYDSVSAYRADEQGHLKGTLFFRRFGTLSLPPIFLRRAALDWINLVRHRRQMDFPFLWLPLLLLLGTGLRTVEFAGALAAAFRTSPKPAGGASPAI